MSPTTPQPPDWLPEFARDEFERLANEILRANRGNPSALIAPWESLAGHLACAQAKFASLDATGRQEVARARLQFNLAPFFEAAP